MTDVKMLDIEVCYTDSLDSSAIMSLRHVLSLERMAMNPSLVSHKDRLEHRLWIK